MRKRPGCVSCLTIVLISLIAGLLLSDWAIGWLGFVPTLGWPQQSVVVAGSLCGTWEIRPSPAVGLVRDAPEIQAMDGRSADSLWLVGHVHDAYDNTTPAFLSLHMTLNGIFSRAVLSPNPPNYS